MISVLAVPRSMAISCVKKLNNPISCLYALSSTYNIFL
jgi:hypothetical protein